jgi:hypothetical protein
MICEMQRRLWVWGHGHSTRLYGKAVGGRGVRTPGRRILERIEIVILGGHVALD